MASKTMNDNEDRRVLDCFYTQFGTKLFVENGVLVEQKLKPPPSSSSSAKVDPNLISVPPPTFEKDGDDFTSAPVYSPHPPPPRKELSSAEIKKFSYERCIKISHEGLAYYNRKHPKTQYALVRPIDCNSFIRNGFWFHSLFLAQPLGDDGDSGKRCFFAEVTANGVRHGTPIYLVTLCSPLDGSQATLGCEICNSLPHPLGGFLRGNPQSRILRSRTRSSIPRAYGDSSGAKSLKGGEGGGGSKHTFCLKIEDLHKYIPNFDASDNEWMQYM